MKLNLWRIYKVKDGTYHLKHINTGLNLFKNKAEKIETDNHYSTCTAEFLKIEKNLISARVTDICLIQCIILCSHSNMTQLINILYLRL